jgi:hypothetical protein
MAFIHWKLYVLLHKLIRTIIDFLPKSQRFFVPVHDFHVSCPPAVMAFNVEPITPAAVL